MDAALWQGRQACNTTACALALCHSGFKCDDGCDAQGSEDCGKVFLTVCCRFPLNCCARKVLAKALGCQYSSPRECMPLRRCPLFLTSQLKCSQPHDSNCAGQAGHNLQV
eukprot:1159486-Pelagomonas_calceolata.AAC.2